MNSIMEFSFKALLKDDFCLQKKPQNDNSELLHCPSVFISILIVKMYWMNTSAKCKWETQWQVKTVVAAVGSFFIAVTTKQCLKAITRLHEPKAEQMQCKWIRPGSLLSSITISTTKCLFHFSSAKIKPMIRWLSIIWIKEITLAFRRWKSQQITLETQ